MSSLENGGLRQQIAGRGGVGSRVAVDAQLERAGWLVYQEGEVLDRRLGL